MKKTVAILILSLSMLNTPCFSGNLCELAIPLGRATELEQRREYESNFKGRSFSGSGRIFDVQGALNDRHVNIIVSCSEQVRIYLQHKNDSRMTAADYKVGQEVSFSGQCIDMERGYYKNAPEKYFFLKLGGDTLTVK